MRADLSHIDSWIFDLDNTLYPARCNLFELIDERMGVYIANLRGCDRDEAYRIQKRFFRDHGTTLAGLMANDGTDPHDFLEFVHDIALDRLERDARLVAALTRLPGRKLVFTNGDALYAGRVLDRLGLGASFEAIHDIHASLYRPKPDPECYAVMCERLGVTPETALFAEDMARNLKPAKALGMTTLWVNNGSEQAEGAPCPSFVDHETHDLADWLETVLAKEDA